ncbi:Ribonuclease/ribotoxin [Tuber magnatum]|uniref:ribonuclease T1 n=1 Tax=Tuber magnatum TaxID=42249 RepID=A0A317T1Z0_9PEZI|nr:Ribonuclease/ribotoxin [Tuber magnatum]
MKFLFLITAIITPTLAAVSGITGVDCDGYTFTSAQVSAAANAALKHLNDGTQVGSNNYPHQFNNFERFTFNSGCTVPYYEFPLYRPYVYTRGVPGPDRVIIGSWNGTDAAFCVIPQKWVDGRNFCFSPSSFFLPVRRKREEGKG